METSEVRRRIKDSIERARRAAAQRRTQMAEAGQAWDEFLERTAVPVFQQVSDVLKSEGYPFHVNTPAGTVRLASGKSGEDFIELRLDTIGARPEVMARIERAKGRETIMEDRPVKSGTLVEHLTEQDVLDFLVDALAPFVER